MEKNPVVIATGASRGIGAATCQWLAKAGATVALLARTENRLQTVARQVEEAGGRAVVAAVDVSDANACRHAAESFFDSL